MIMVQLGFRTLGLYKYERQDKGSSEVQSHMQEGTVHSSGGGCTARPLSSQVNLSNEAFINLETSRDRKVIYRF